MPDTDAYGGQSVSTPDENQWMSVGDAADLIGVSVSTLQRWDRAGILTAHRTPTNQRRYRRGDVLAAVKKAA
jgi:excisionase family DNA binding protein